MLSTLHVTLEVAPERRIDIPNVRNRNKIDISNLQGNGVTTMRLPTSDCGCLFLKWGEILRLDPERNSNKIFEKPGDWQTVCVFGFWIGFQAT